LVLSLITFRNFQPFLSLYFIIMKTHKNTVLMSLLLSTVMCFQAAFAEFQINRVVAIVNGKIITQSELEMIMLPQVRILFQKYPNQGSQFQEEFKEIQKQTLEVLIEEKLILDEFDNLGGQIPEIAIKNAISDEIEDIYKGDESQFYAKLKDSKLTLESYEKIIYKRIAVQALKSQQMNKISPLTPDELSAEYRLLKSELRDVAEDQAQFDKIYIPKPNQYNPNLSAQAQQQKAQEVIDKLEQGENFASLAKEYSQDSYASAGGKSPMVKRKDLSREFGELIFDNPLNTVIGPLEDKLGYTFIKINERKLAPPMSLNEAKPILEKQISIKKRNSFLQDWLKQLREKADINIKL